jgi:hypothetical protein
MEQGVRKTETEAPFPELVEGKKSSVIRKPAPKERNICRKSENRDKIVRGKAMKKAR